ncbi:MAG: hypothetical protein KatS3mg002_0433 [Candidatus Woesearchaeota archaeon]|nr:MAG: hypothetical protein KatS3mg002_0433 [Candidatus Woesearchaeota archaeon]
MGEIIVLIAIGIYTFVYFTMDHSELAKLLRSHGNTPKTKVVALDLQEKLKGMRVAIKEEFNKGEHIIHGYVMSKQFKYKPCSDFDVWGTEIYRDFSTRFSEGIKTLSFLDKDGNLIYVINQGTHVPVACGEK